MAQFLLDENIPVDVKDWLIKKGFKIINVSQTNLKGAKDSVIAEYASKNNIPIITLDQGFARIYRVFPGTLTIIIIKVKPATSVNIIQTLNIAQQKISLKNIQDLQDKLVIISRKKIRIIK